MINYINLLLEGSLIKYTELFLRLTFLSMERLKESTGDIAVVLIKVRYYMSSNFVMFKLSRYIFVISAT